jgi:hypothetical protein
MAGSHNASIYAIRHGFSFLLQAGDALAKNRSPKPKSNSSRPSFLVTLVAREISIFFNLPRAPGDRDRFDSGSAGSPILLQRRRH